jgi:glycosyltransferase involved in cell wall biosynthesis
MDYYPNQDAVTWFCREVLPGIRARRPAARLSIIGAEPPPQIRRLAQTEGVEVSGSVPDVRPLLRRAAVTVAPLRIARGTQNKILESMAMGVPVVSSPEAAGGVDAVPGAHFLTAATPAEWVSAVTGVLADTGLRASLARAARERVLSHHSWDASMRRLDRLIEEARVRKSSAAG